VVFLHGYGADGNDLISLGQEWQRLLPGAAFVSPHAPERCAMAGAGFQWFPLTRLEPEETARGVAKAAPVLNEFLNAELQRCNLSGDRLVLVGFSQGTMMALHVGLRRQMPPAAIVGFSGMLSAPEATPACQGGPPLLLLHGGADEVIPDMALFLSAGALGAAGYTVQWHRVPRLGHGIDPTGLALAGAFLAGSFAGRFKPVLPASSNLPRVSV
jgi:phospholipase/carboxylesterase